MACGMQSPLCGTVEEMEKSLASSSSSSTAAVAACLGTKKASKQKDESPDGQAHTEFIEINLGVGIPGGLHKLVFLRN